MNVHPGIDDDELEACPFCGGEATISEGSQGGKQSGGAKPWWYVECIDCAAMTDSVEAWNARTRLPEAVEHQDSLSLIRLIELLKAMDLQATKLTHFEGAEEIIDGYQFNTGCWHRILGCIAGHQVSKWLQTPEGQARVAEAAELARLTIEEMRKAREIDPKILNERFTSRSPLAEFRKEE